MKMKKWAAAAALIGLSSQVSAQPACLTNAEAETMIQALLPSLIENISEQCGSYLPANAGLIARSGALSQRYAPAAESVRAEAAVLALRIFDGDDAPPVEKDAGGELVLGIFEMGIAVAMSEAMDGESCPIADRVFTALEPLPSRNFSSLLTLLIEIGSSDDDNEDPGPFAICGVGEG